MATTDTAPPNPRPSRTEAAREAGRAFQEFVTIPTIVIVAFLLLAAGAIVLENSDLGWLRPLGVFLQRHVFGDASATQQLLSTVAGGLLTLISITFSLLLIAVQQSASTMTHEIFDQFLRRRLNQFYFGFFVGLVLYDLVILASVDAQFNPIYGATLALLLTVVALYLLIMLLYTTVNQMRPAQIVESIHEHVFVARVRQLRLIRRTRRAPRPTGGAGVIVPARRHGYLVGIAIEPLASAVREAGPESEVILRAPIGTFIPFGDPIAEVRAGTDATTGRVVEAVHAAIQLERVRNLEHDPTFGIQQLQTIAAAAASTTKHGSVPILVIRSLRDLVARWSLAEQSNDQDPAEVAPVVCPDNLLSTLTDALGALAVAAGQASQDHALAEAVRAVAVVYRRMPADQQARADGFVLRGLSLLGTDVPSTDLADALNRLAETLAACGRHDTAAAVRQASAAAGELKPPAQIGQRPPA